MKRFLFGDGQFINSLLGRFTLVNLFAIVWSLVLSLLFLLDNTLPTAVIKYSVLAAMGLGAGIMARNLLRGYTQTFRLLSALFAVLVALFLLYETSLGLIGIAPLSAYERILGWDAFLQLLVAGGAAWLALAAWGERRISLRFEPEGRPTATPRIHPAQRVRTPRTPLRQRAANWFASLGPRLRRLPGQVGERLKESTARVIEPVLPDPRRSRIRPRGKLKVSQAVKAGKRPKRPRWSLGKASPIHLSADVEHRCPYCLETVTKGDPRGVHVCKICHTWHHQDCWDVAGVCQVPHEFA